MNDGAIPEAKCPKCGARYLGWALHDSKHQKCKKCGAQLEVLDRGQSGSVAKQELGMMEREILTLDD